MCAVIKRGILGGFSNKIGNVVGTSWKGIAVMKSLPLSVANPRTAGQVIQRSKFGTISFVASQWLSTIIKPLWDRFSGQMSGFNSFVKANIANVDDAGNVDWTGISISLGNLNTDAIVSATAVGATNVLTINYVSTAGTGSALSTDLTYVGVVRGDGLGFWGISNDTRGAAGAQSVVINTIDIIAGQIYHLYLAFKRADGTMVSGSTQITITAS